MKCTLPYITCITHIYVRLNTSCFSADKKSLNSCPVDGRRNQMKPLSSCLTVDLSPFQSAANSTLQMLLPNNINQGPKTLNTFYMSNIYFLLPLQLWERPQTTQH